MNIFWKGVRLWTGILAGVFVAVAALCLPADWVSAVIFFALGTVSVVFLSMEK